MPQLWGRVIQKTGSGYKQVMLWSDGRICYDLADKDGVIYKNGTVKAQQYKPGHPETDVQHASLR